MRVQSLEEYASSRWAPNIDKLRTSYFGVLRNIGRCTVQCRRLRRRGLSSSLARLVAGNVAFEGSLEGSLRYDVMPFRAVLVPETVPTFSIR